ncbi:MAG: hypothetical protein CMJ45_05425 [Planctomyces sp.]|nr:hypothetical protein [Planctomyces sp.]
MGVQVAGLMIITLAILVLTLMSQVAVTSELETTSAATETIDSTGDRARTNMEFVDSSAAFGELTVELKNTGFTTVFDFSQMDFIVEYLDSSDNEVITRLTYTTGALGNNEWTKTSISPDGFQPNAWDPSESVVLDAKLSPTQKAETIAAITVSTPSGVSAISSFGADGFFWFVDSPDISLTIIGSWQDIDLTTHVPTGTTGAIVEVINTGTFDTQSGLVRGKEDSRDYMSDVLFEEIEDETHRWQIVKVDTNAVIQGYIENTQVDFKLRGYTLGSDPSYFSVPPDITPVTSDAWTIVDVSANVDNDSDGVILFLDSIQSAKREYGVREHGSSFDITNRELEDYGNTMYLVGLDALDQFEVFIENVAHVQVYLVGQTKGSVVYNLEDVLVADPSIGSWQAIEASDYNVPEAANGVFLCVESTGADEISGFVHGDSTDTWTPDVGGDTHMMAGTGISADNLWDEYLEDTDVDVYIAAYTIPLTNE